MFNAHSSMFRGLSLLCVYVIVGVPFTYPYWAEHIKKPSAFTQWVQPLISLTRILTECILLWNLCFCNTMCVVVCCRGRITPTICQSSQEEGSQHGFAVNTHRGYFATWFIRGIAKWLSVFDPRLAKLRIGFIVVYTFTKAVFIVNHTNNGRCGAYCQAHWWYSTLPTPQKFATTREIRSSWYRPLNPQVVQFQTAGTVYSYYIYHNFIFVDLIQGLWLCKQHIP